MSKPTKKTIVQDKQRDSQPLKKSHDEADKEHWKDFLLLLIEIHYGHIGHYQTQRSTISNILVLVSAALLAFISFDKVVDDYDYPFIFALMVIGLFGAMFCWKYNERTFMLHAFYEDYRDVLERKLFNSTFIKTLEAHAEERHKRTYWIHRKIKIWDWLKISRLWICFHIIILGCGCMLLCKAYNHTVERSIRLAALEASQPQSTSLPALGKTPSLIDTAVPAAAIDTPPPPTSSNISTSPKIGNVNGSN